MLLYILLLSALLCLQSSAHPHTSRFLAPSKGYISEVFYKKGDSDDFIEAVVPKGAKDYSIQIYDQDGKLKDITYKLDQLAKTYSDDEFDLYLINKAKTNGFKDLKDDQAIALVRNDGQVEQFISFKKEIKGVEGPAMGKKAQYLGESDDIFYTENNGFTYQTHLIGTPGVLTTEEYMSSDWPRGFISEVSYKEKVIELALPKRASNYSLLVYKKEGDLDFQYVYDSLGTPVNQTVDYDVYVLSKERTDDWDDIHDDNGIALVNAKGLVDQFICFKDPVTVTEGAYVGLNASQIGETDDIFYTADGGISYQVTKHLTEGVVITPSPTPYPTLNPTDSILYFAFNHTYCGAKHPPIADLDKQAAEMRILTKVQATDDQRRLCIECVVIETHFHIVAVGPGLAGDMDDWQVSAQIGKLNADFAGSPFQFQLVNITRTYDADLFYLNGEKFRDDVPSMQSEFGDMLRVGDRTVLNFYTLRLRSRGLGVATFPTAYAGSKDGVFIDHCTMPSGYGCGGMYATGDIAVHEVGHWLGLLHTFEGGCNSEYGDYVSDTVPQAIAKYSCPSPGVVEDTCPEIAGHDPHNNTMGYGVQCYAGFTDGQIARMHDQWKLYREGTEVCKPNEGILTVMINTDDTPEENFWRLYHQNGQMIAMGEFGASEENKMHIVDICLPYGTPVYFGLGDEDNDGLSGPQAEFIVKFDGRVLKDDTIFQLWAGVGFTMLAPSSCTSDEVLVVIDLLLDNRPLETSWRIEDSNGNIVYDEPTYRLRGSSSYYDGASIRREMCLPLAEGDHTLILEDSGADGFGTQNDDDSSFVRVSVDGVELFKEEGFFACSLTATLIPSTMHPDIATCSPSAVPSEMPSVSLQPSFIPTLEPSLGPTFTPTSKPTPEPTPQPTTKPTAAPTAAPTPDPTLGPTANPTPQPTLEPSISPSIQHSSGPSMEPTPNPSPLPTPEQSASPSIQHSSGPSSQPTPDPTNEPTPGPTANPMPHPTLEPSISPTIQHSSGPSMEPTSDPTPQPTPEPSTSPSIQHSSGPSSQPTPEPTESPTTASPTPEPTPGPTPEPTLAPVTAAPTPEPTPEPTTEPTPEPTPEPTQEPTPEPTPEPTQEPTPELTLEPTPEPTTPGLSLEFTPPAPTPAPIVCLDFSMSGDGTELNNGDFVSDDWLEKYSLTITSLSYDDGPTQARVVDSSDPIHTGLGSPNKECPVEGPGKGNEGKPGEPGENCEPLGNILIVQDPLTDNNIEADDGSITFNFDCPLDSLISVSFLDMRVDTTIEIVTESGPVVKSMNALGDNAAQTEVLNVANVNSVTLNFPEDSESAVSSICFQQRDCSTESPTSAPTEAPVPTISPAPTFAPETYRDDFNTKSYSNSNGSLFWSGSWTEIGESDGPFYGQVKIDTYSNTYLYLGSDGYGAVRPVDLSPFSSADLTYRVGTNGIGDGTMLVEISRDNLAWTTIDTVVASTGVFTHALSLDAFCGAPSFLRVWIPPGATIVYHINIDYIEIKGTPQAPTPAPTLGPTYLASSASPSERICDYELPTPVIALDRIEYTTPRKYFISITNAGDYDNNLFKSSPNVPSCGQNDGSRSMVNFYRASDNKQLWGNCLWSRMESQVEFWTHYGDDMYMIVEDRLCPREKKSNIIVV